MAGLCRRFGQKDGLAVAQKQALGVAAVIFAAMLWGTTGTTAALLPPTREPLVVGALRLAFGALALVVLAQAQPRMRAGLGALPWGGITFAGTCIAGYNLLFFWAVSLAGVGVGTAITIGSAPIWATAFEALRTGRLPKRWLALGQLCAISGVCLLAWAGGSADAGTGGDTVGGPSVWAGVALSAAAGACYAAYSLATSRISHSAPSTTLAAATFCVAALICAPVLLVLPLGWLVGVQAWAGVVFLGLGATGLAYALYTWGLTRISASGAVTLALAEPVTAWVLAVAVVGEALSAPKAAGALLIFLGLALVSASALRPNSAGASRG